MTGSFQILEYTLVVGLGLACGLVLRLGLVSGTGFYKWLFYLATVRQLNHVGLEKGFASKLFF